MNIMQKRAIRNLLHENIDVHSRRLIADFPKDEINFIDKFQSHCANITFSEKVDMTVLFKKSHIKEGNLHLITLKYSIIHMLYQFQYETIILRINLCTHLWITFTKVENILLK